MTKEDKELLLKDLCSRVLHLPIVYIEGDWYDDAMESYNSTLTLAKLEDFQSHDYIMKPYLRPMSSMTDEEVKEFNTLVGYEEKGEWIRCNNICGSYGINIIGCSDMIDWLNAHYFDYRGLIPMGLAIEAVNMY